MNAHQRKVIIDHARKAGHLVGLWDKSDIAWYTKYKFQKKQTNTPRSRK